MSAAKNSQPYYYVALGDSLANGVGAKDQGYPLQLSKLLQNDRETVLHLFAKNGQTSTQLFRKRQLFQDYLRLADLVTVNIGGNDLRITWKLYGHKPIPQSIQRKRFELALTTLANNWNELAKYLIEHTPSKSKIIFLNLYNPYLTQYPQTEGFVAEANKLLETVCANHGIEYADIQKVLGSPQQDIVMHEDWLAEDSLHLNEAGYAMIADYIYSQVSTKSLWQKLLRFIRMH